MPEWHKICTIFSEKLKHDHVAMPVAVRIDGWVQPCRDRRIQGHHLHGAFFRWLRAVAPDLARRWHARKDKPFTISPLFLAPDQERAVWRWTVFTDVSEEENFCRLLWEHLLQTEFLIGTCRWVPYRIDWSRSRWAETRSWYEFCTDLPMSQEVAIILKSPFAVRDGNIDRLMPTPRLLFIGYYRTFHQSAPPSICAKMADPRPWLDRLVVRRFRLQTVAYPIYDRTVMGTVGWLRIRIPDDVPEPVRASLWILTRWAVFRGTGRKTPYGMGMTLTNGWKCPDV